MLSKEKTTSIETLQQFAYQTNNMSLYHFQILLECYDAEDIFKALTESSWAVLELVFQFNIPEDLLEILEELAANKEINDSDKNDLETVMQIKSLYDAFKENFGRLPFIFSHYVYACREFDAKLLCQSFKVKSLRYALSLNEEVNSTHHQIVLSTIFGNRIFDVVKKLKKYNRDVYNFISGLPPKYPINDQNLVNWIIEHAGKSPNIFIQEVATLWNEDGFPVNGKVSEMKNYISKKRADKEWERCKEKFPFFFTKSFKCTIIDTPIHIGNEKVRLLEANDRLQVLLGHLTVCCQKLGAGGEPSMMEGLINQDSGFLVFERDHKVIAQSWIWLSEDKSTLVLDNIELADGRVPEDILHLLEKWVEHSPYINIQMGTGYNRVEIGELVSEPLVWYKQHWHLKYSDAFRRVWLKKQGKSCLNENDSKRFIC
ncbi:MAG: hypothetical protein ACQEXE_16260 [Bacillota bacterium]